MTLPPVDGLILDVADPKGAMGKNPYEGQHGNLPRSITDAGFTEKFFQTGNVQLHYIEGPNNGPAMVLIPAQIATLEDYQKVAPELSKQYHVFSLDLRGHGNSSWTTGDYSWKRLGEDLRAFLQQVVKEPAIISGNSSGGIVALWCGANVPKFTRAIVLEDSPLFSVEMPRFRDKDKYTYNGLKHIADSLGVQHDLANFFRIEAPVRKGDKVVIKRIPPWFVNLMGWLIRKQRRKHPDRPVDIPYLPLAFRLTIKSLDMFDPDFSRAFVDGRMYTGINHKDALERVTCPMLIMHSNWFRDPQYGLIGAMDSADAAHAKAIKPDIVYKKLDATHVIHFHDPQLYLKTLEDFLQNNVLVTGQAPPEPLHEPDGA